MSENHKNIKQYTAADIQAYLDGRMNNAEMLALEKAALDDPFLADAIEGMQEARLNYSDPVINTQLEKARQQLADRVQKDRSGRVVSFPWKQLAAAAVVIIIGGVWFFNNNKGEQNAPRELADSKKINQVTDSNTGSAALTQKDNPENNLFAVPESDAKAEPLAINKAKIEAAPAIRYSDKNDKENLEKLAGRKAPPLSRQSDEIVQAEKKYERDSNIASPRNDDRSRSKDVIAAAPVAKSEGEQKRELFKSQKESESAAAGNITQLNYFNGKVTDSLNRPVAFATVSLLNNKNAYTTDQFGFFKFQSPDTVVTVGVTGIGFNSQNFQLRNDVAMNQLQLQRDNKALNETVVVGYGNAKRRNKNQYLSRAPKVMVQDAEPADGWIEFQKYIDANKKTFTASDSGEVVVSFVLNNKAKLDNFKIEQSLGDEQDKEAIRLIKEGPGWRLLKGKKAKVYVIIKF